MCQTLIKDPANLNRDIFIIVGERQIKLNADYVANFYLPHIDMASNELGLAIKNLLHNAIKYSFKTAQQEEKRSIKIIVSTHQNKEYIILIQNYGIGIEKNEIDNGLIFKPRYRGINAKKASSIGAGLGLSYAYNSIIKVHNGKINVMSEPIGDSTIMSAGYSQPHLTTFTITIPFSQLLKYSQGGMNE
jgi:signal transduction histidine kinase